MTEEAEKMMNENRPEKAETEPQEAESPMSEDEAARSSEAISPGDSATFMRCAECRHAKEVDVSGGTLACAKHNMIINAEADEIPDDCPEHEPHSG